MSQQNVEVARRAFDSFNRRQLAAAVEAFGADAEWVPYLAALEEHIYRGRERIEAMWREVLRDFPDFRIELVEVVMDQADTIVVEVEFQGMGRASGADTRTTVFQVVTFHAGKVGRVEGFRDRAEALEAAGLRAMSKENVAVALEVVAAANRRDADAFVACLSPDVEWEENGDIPGARVIYRGRPEVRKWFEEVLAEPWERFHIQVEEIREASGGGVFSGLLITARGRGSGAETKLRFWTASWLADGKVARRQVFWNRGEALEAVGLRE